MKTKPKAESAMYDPFESETSEAESTTKSSNMPSTHGAPTLNAEPDLSCAKSGGPEDKGDSLNEEPPEIASPITKNVLAIEEENVGEDRATSLGRPAFVPRHHRPGEKERNESTKKRAKRDTSPSSLHVHSSSRKHLSSSHRRVPKVYTDKKRPPPAPPRGLVSSHQT